MNQSKKLLALVPSKPSNCQIKFPLSRFIRPSNCRRCLLGPDRTRNIKGATFCSRVWVLGSSLPFWIHSTKCVSSRVSYKRTRVGGLRSATTKGETLMRSWLSLLLSIACLCGVACHLRCPDTTPTRMIETAAPRTVVARASKATTEGLQCRPAPPARYSSTRTHRPSRVALATKW